MKKLIVILIIFSLIAIPSVSFAAKGGERGASEQAYEHASDQAVFHRVGDWFATVGKSKEEKDKIKAERRAKREAERIRKEAEKQAEGIKQDTEKKSQETLRVRDREREQVATQEMQQAQEKQMMQKTKSTQMKVGSGQGMQKSMSGMGTRGK